MKSCSAFVRRNYSAPGRCEKRREKSGLCKRHFEMIREGKTVVMFDPKIARENARRS